MEIAKCDKKLDLAKMSLDKILKVEAQADYETTIPENVRLANEDKVRTMNCLFCMPHSDTRLGSNRGKLWRQTLPISCYLRRCLPS